MRVAILVLVTALLSNAALADRYGIEEAIADSGPPGWFWPIAFVALLFFHFREVSNLQSEVARLSVDCRAYRSANAQNTNSNDDQTKSEILQLKKELQEASVRTAICQENYLRIQGLIQSYFDGDMTDRQFVDAAEAFVVRS